MNREVLRDILKGLSFWKKGASIFNIYRKPSKKMKKYILNRDMFAEQQNIINEANETSENELTSVFKDIPMLIMHLRYIDIERSGVSFYLDDEIQVDGEDYKKVFFENWEDKGQDTCVYVNKENLDKVIVIHFVFLEDDNEGKFDVFHFDGDDLLLHNVLVVDSTDPNRVSWSDGDDTSSKIAKEHTYL